MSANAEFPLGTPDEPAAIRDARRAYQDAGDKLDNAAGIRETAQQRYVDAQAALAHAEKIWGDAMAECNRAFANLSRALRRDVPDVSLALAEHTAHALNTLSGGAS